MTDDTYLHFIRQRIPQSCHSLLDIFTTNEQLQQYELAAAADRWLLDATSSQLGQNGFVWSELLKDLAHYYPLSQDDCLIL